MTSTPLKTRVRAAGRRIARAVAPAVSRGSRLEAQLDEQAAAVKGLRRQVRQLNRQVSELRGTRRQIAQLRKEIDETRRLHQRVAELTDAVAELLVPAVDRDDARVQKALETFAKTTF